MPTLKSIHLAPVKSLALLSVERVNVTTRGIDGDRRFIVLDSAGRVVTQRQLGKLTRVTAEYSSDTDTLRMCFPDGQLVVGHPGVGPQTATVLWGRVIRGKLVTGEWAGALSEFCGAELTLMKAEGAGACFDEYPVSVMSQASIDLLSGLTRGAKTFEVERFRPTLLLDGCGPHEEDSWLGAGIRIGDRLRLRLISRDPRCAITTLDPASGERDFDTLRLILSYRPNPRAAYFGVYGIVETPGVVSVGDEVELR